MEAERARHRRVYAYFRLRMDALQQQINRLHERVAEERVSKELMERALHFLEAEVLAADRNRVQLE
eukprot:6844978-Prorocentrum_lima.AAC.1